MAIASQAILHLVCTAGLMCLAYQYFSIGSGVHAHLEQDDGSIMREQTRTSVDAASLVSISAHAVIDEGEGTGNDGDFGSLLQPSPVLTPTMGFHSPKEAASKAPQGSREGGIVKKNVVTQAAKPAEIKIEPSAVLSSSEGTVTSMKVRDIRPVFPFQNGFGDPGPGQCGGPAPGGGGPPQNGCGGPPQGGYGGPPQGGCGGAPQGGCGGAPQGGCGGAPQGGCGGPPQGGCGGPQGGGCGGPPQGGCGGQPGGGCGGPPQGGCGGPAPGGQMNGGCGAGGFGIYGNANQMHHGHDQSWQPDRSTEFTTSAAASFRTKLLTEPGKPIAHMPSGEEVKPLNNEVSAIRPENPREDLETRGTSVWCWGTNHTNRLCRFRNLCYISDLNNFVFFHSEHSIMSGVPQKRFDPALLDLTTVEDHNVHYFNYVDMPIDALGKFDVTYDETRTLMFSRFLNDNIMHVFHDDLIPAFHTLLMMTNNDVDAIRDIQLLLSDDLENGDFFSLYKLMSKREILRRQSLHGKKKNVCFKDIHVGLSKMTLWYQYGYRIPQGPVPNFKSAPGIVREFTNFFRKQLNPKEDNFLGNLVGDYFVLFTRRDNRRITNEEKLVMGVANHLNMQVRTASLEDHQPAQIIDLLSKAQGAIGMHGSLLVLAMFLRPGSRFLELFPYGVNASQYTPFRTMARIPGVDLSYRAWRNRNKTRSAAFPDRSPEMGGIRYLPKEEQKIIEQADEVPPHLCCKDPHWLYRIYQDTSVNVKTVLRLLNSTKDESEQYFKSLRGGKWRRNLYPGKIEELSCESEPQGDGKVKLNLVWEEPSNLKYFGQNDLSIKYDVWIQEVGKEDYAAWEVSGGSQHSFPGFDKDVKYQIWVRAIVNERVGPFNNAYVCEEEEK